VRFGCSGIRAGRLLLLTQNMCISVKKPSSDIPPSARELNPSDTKVNFGIQFAHIWQNLTRYFSTRREMQILWATLSVAAVAADRKVANPDGFKGRGISLQLSFIYSFR
jgi:hypothetical protein